MTFKDVPSAKVAKEVERMINNKVPADRRTEIYHKVLTVSNQDLLDALAHAAEITLMRAKSIGIQITWWDAMSDGAFPSMMSFGGGVSSGRLGRPHKLDNVPINYFRDRLINWIDESLEAPEDMKQEARKAICLGPNPRRNRRILSPYC